jgi:hypothetical protein
MAGEASIGVSHKTKELFDECKRTYEKRQVHGGSVFVDTALSHILHEWLSAQGNGSKASNNGKG